MEFDIALDKHHLQQLGHTEPLTGVIELIWNSLDADADAVEVRFGRNELDGIEDIQIIDDGHGMRPGEIRELFGALGGSWKRTRKRSRQKERALHGRDGRGRFRAAGIGNRIRWRTVARNEDGRGLLSVIELRHSDLAHVVVSDPEDTTEPPGTTVVIDELLKPPAGLTGQGAIDRLTASFALQLETHHARLTYDHHEIDPASLQTNRADYPLEAEGDDALLTVVEWARTIERGLYLCDETGTPLVEHSPGIRAPGFDFTAYLQWTGFTDADQSDLALVDLESGERKRLLEAARDKLREHFKVRAKERTREQIREWKAENTYPFSGEPENDAARAVRDVFDVVALSASSVVNAAEERARRFSLRLLREALEQDPGSLRRVLQEVLDLPQDRLEELSLILQRTPLTALIELSKEISNRLEFLAGLEELVLNPDVKRHVKERSQLHKILAGETWVFGEEYTLTVNDQSLTTVLERHIAILGRPELAEEPVKDLEGHDRIVDLMLARAVPQQKNRREHVIIELKAPSVKVGDDEAAQIRKYAGAVVGDQRFDVKDTEWDFYVISGEIKGTPLLERESKDRPVGQIMNAGGVRVWVLTWAEVIESAKHRLKFVQDHLDYQPDAAQALEYLRQTHNKYLPPEVQQPDDTQIGTTSPTPLHPAEGNAPDDAAPAS